ncbi:MAG TPA: 4-carboxymuconolactone decarboxylase [Roseiarcus sp.]|nr:4-carboxymuconolactone decarboxylase [Roseiarcus sp.]
MSEKRRRSAKFERGLATRREVLGDAHVDRSLRQADDFSWPLQQLITEYAWDEIWNRPGLDRRSRSLLNIGVLAALNRPHELKVHIRGAINNGLTRDEIKEAFLQVGAYCGLPAAVDGFRVAREAFKEMDEG